MREGERVGAPPSIKDAISSEEDIAPLILINKREI